MPKMMRWTSWITAAVAAFSAVNVLLACGDDQRPPTTPTSAPSNNATRESGDATGAASATMHVIVSGDGTAIMSGERVRTNDLTKRVRDALHREPKLQFIVDADGDIAYSRVILVMNELKAAGATRLAVGSITPAPNVATLPITPGVSVQSVLPPEPHAAVDPTSKWDCPFPPANERAGLTDASVLVKVHVDLDGAPVRAEVVGDPPSPGFAEAARTCAMTKKYQAARKPDGEAIRATTFPFWIRFVVKQ